MQWMKRYCDSINGCANYNALERRETCKGGKEASKRAAQSQSSAKGTTVSQRTHSSHNTNARRNDVPHSGNSTNHSVKASRPSSSGGPAPPVHDEEITELKLSVDSLEKERDFYFGKLRDIGILCQTPEIQHLPVVGAVLKIMYATDDDATIMAQAQATLSAPSKDADPSRPRLASYSRGFK